ncbi:MAG: 6-phosphogluconolactonase [Deinococcales bacterium]|nr:6-phosphogluconolactonase [Chitinophagaceae bacterium]
MNLHTAATKTDLIIDFANWLINDIESTLTTKKRYTIALSGGSTPTELYKILATEFYKSKIDWQKIHIFWGDERDVAFEDDRNNAKQAFDLLLNKVPVPPNQIHIINTYFSADIAARKYDQLLHEYFDRMPTSFDLVILGMGDDGHTLSLFPGTPAVNEAAKWAISFYLAAQQMHRITITAPIANKAAAICFLVAGSSKASILKEVLQGDYQPNMYPSQLIKPINGNLHWFVDKDAATLL